MGGAAIIAALKSGKSLMTIIAGILSKVIPQVIADAAADFLGAAVVGFMVMNATMAVAFAAQALLPDSYWTEGNVENTRGAFEVADVTVSLIALTAVAAIGVSNLAFAWEMGGLAAGIVAADVDIWPKAQSVFNDEEYDLNP